MRKIDFLNLRILSLYFVFLFCVCYFFKFIYLANGSVLNSYPFITSDGFDWIVEGEYFFASLFSDSSLPVLPVLRPPTFVLISGLDYYLGGQGYVLALCFSLSIIFTYVAILRIVDVHYGDAKKISWFVIPLTIAVTLHPINFIRTYILSDILAVSLSLCSVYLLLKFFDKEKKINLTLSMILAVVASLTQTYTLIPYLIFILVKIISDFCKKKTESINHYVKFLLVVIVFYFSVLYIWRKLMPHLITPNNFNLLQPSFLMLDFYTNTWGYLFAPIFIFLIMRFHSINFSAISLVSMGALLTAITMGILIFCYQWPESRFTYFLWPWLLISIFTLFKLKRKSKAGTFLSILLVMFSIICPKDYWNPRLDSLSFDFQKNWTFVYFQSKSVDRKLLNCDSGECVDSNFFLNSDPYVKSVIVVHEKMKRINHIK